MSNTPKRSIGTVAFNDNNFMPIAKVVHSTENSLTSLADCVPNDKKNRWGFLIVGYEESKELRASADDETILKNIKSKYSPIIQSAIKTNAGKLGQSTFPHQDKLIFLEQSLVKSIGDLKSLLKSESCHCQANEKIGFVASSFCSLLRLKEHLNAHILVVCSALNNLFALNRFKNVILQNHFYGVNL